MGNHIGIIRLLERVDGKIQKKKSGKSINCIFSSGEEEEMIPPNPIE